MMSISVYVRVNIFQSHDKICKLYTLSLSRRYVQGSQNNNHSEKQVVVNFIREALSHSNLLPLQATCNIINNQCEGQFKEKNLELKTGQKWLYQCENSIMRKNFGKA